MVTASRETLKHTLLSLLQDINEGDDDAHASEIADLTNALALLSPIPDPVNRLPAVAGSWTSIYAKFGSGRSQGKSHLDDSTLGLRSFRTFPDIPIRIKGMFQEIGINPAAYNNVDFFETIVADPAEKQIAGMIIIHGSYIPDDNDPRRFRVVFHGAEIRPRDMSTEDDLRRVLGFAADESLKRDFKPAKLHSDVIYLDETLRINLGGMGGVYILERRTDPAISL